MFQTVVIILCVRVSHVGWMHIEENIWLERKKKSVWLPHIIGFWNPTWKTWEIFFTGPFLSGYSRICYSVGMKLISVEYIKLQDINKCSAEAESNILGSAYFCLAE